MRIEIDFDPADILDALGRVPSYSWWSDLRIGETVADVRAFESQDDDSDEVIEHVPDFKRGLTMMLHEGYGVILSSWTASQCDIFLQFSCFGEERYA